MHTARQMPSTPHGSDAIVGTLSTAFERILQKDANTRQNNDRLECLINIAIGQGNGGKALSY